MREFIYSLMTDKRRGIVFAPFKFLLLLASFIYAFGILSRRVLYKIGVFRTAKAPLKVVSVGNLTLGGTGKTPFTVGLAEIVKNDLKKDVCVLTRGYGWDEQELLKKKLADTPLLVGEDRVRQSHRAVRLYGSHVAILDDGFQYWELQRGLDIVLIDSRNPFGNGRLFPRGVLREDVSALRRAHAVVFTKVDKKRVSLGTLRDELRSIKKELIFLEAFHKPVHLYDAKTRGPLGLETLKGKKVVLVSSIGDPAYFEETVQDIGAHIVMHLAYSDHHNYTQEDITFIAKRCGERNFDHLITTEKDLVKLTRLGVLSAGGRAFITVVVKMQITKGKEELVARLHRLFSC